MMSESTTPNYSGDNQFQPPSKGDEDKKGRFYYPYIPSDDLKEAVNLAIALERPLLLEGDPGCGKTCLAGAIAYEFTQHYLRGGSAKSKSSKSWPFYIWNVKSTSRAREGLYTFDAVTRLRDTQIVGAIPRQNRESISEELEELGEEIKNSIDRLNDKKKYREFGPLGNALRHEQLPEDAWHKDLRPVVLIDEIDKADSDFANDLLLELQDYRFEIPETGEAIKPPKCKPIILITSNRERPLPEPFLRRCIYFYVEFPGTEGLRNIIEKRFSQEAIHKEGLVSKAIERFQEIRDLLDKRPGSRPPGTSEFLEFLSALLNKEPKEALKDLDSLSKRLPLLGILLKTQTDQKFYQDQYPSRDE
jgi:MoxR-like ATPase